MGVEGVGNTDLAILSVSSRVPDNWTMQRGPAALCALVEMLVAFLNRSWYCTLPIPKRNHCIWVLEKLAVNRVVYLICLVAGTYSPQKWPAVRTNLSVTSTPFATECLFVFPL